jgi:DNA-binding GntR family transcriptional regulator
MGRLKALTSSSLREQAVQVIRASIIAGELEPGEIYSATVLADRLGVSPTPVREAMLDLASTGLVTPVRNRGFRVVVPEDRDLDEISELRTMLEVPAMRLVAERASDRELDGLERLVAANEAAAENGEPAAFLLADREFHLALFEIVGNGRLVRLISQLRDQTVLVGIKALAESGRLTQYATEHRDLLEALRAREGERAETIMRFHLKHTREDWAGRGAPADAGREG